MDGLIGLGLGVLLGILIGALVMGIFAANGGTPDDNYRDDNGGIV